MAEITRYNGNIKPFAADALSLERTVFGDTAQSDTLADNINAEWFRGWGIVGVNELPTKQDFNAAMYTSTALTAYLYQMGVPEWNTSQEYFTGSITNEGGTLYKAVQDNTGEQPSLDDGSNWEQIGGGFTISGLTQETPTQSDFIPFQDSSDSDLPKKALISSLYAAIAPSMHVQEKYTNGTSAGTITAGAFRTRVLNSVIKNDISGASLSSNRVTLPAGDYYIDLSSIIDIGTATFAVKTRIYDVTNATTLINGEGLGAGLTAGTRQYLTANAKGFVTVASPIEIEVQHYCSVNGSFGSATSLGGIDEIYANLIIKKIG